MVYRGLTQNGVVILEAIAHAPEGAEVSVFVNPVGETGSSQQDSVANGSRMLAMVDQIASLPIEGVSEPFRGADHDRVLYGEP